MEVWHLYNVEEYALPLYRSVCFCVLQDYFPSFRFIAFVHFLLSLYLCIKQEKSQYCKNWTGTYKTIFM